MDRRKFVSLTSCTLLLAPFNAVGQVSALPVSRVPESGASLTGLVSSEDNAGRIQDAVDHASRSGAGIVYLPSGEFPVSSIKMRDRVRLVGRGRSATVLKALASESRGLIELGSGPVRYGGLEDLSLKGGPFGGPPTNPEQWAMFLQSSLPQAGTQHGGLWWSSFRNVEINGFNQGIRLAGSIDNTALPIQFLAFDSLNVTLTGMGGGLALELAGQVNQGVFTQCTFDARQRTRGPLIRIAEARKTSPKMHRFELCTLQNGQVGIDVSGGHNITVQQCWFENDSSGVQVFPNSYAIAISQSRFANVGPAAPAIWFMSGTSGSYRDNLFAGAVTKIPVRIEPGSVVEASGNRSVWSAAQP